MEPAGCGHGPTWGGGTWVDTLLPFQAAHPSLLLGGGGPGSPEQAPERLSGVEGEPGGLG